jgi:hypothetical protein
MLCSLFYFLCFLQVDLGAEKSHYDFEEIVVTFFFLFF